MIRKCINKWIFRFKNKTCKIDTGVLVSRKAKVGENCHLIRNCYISSNVNLGDNVRVGEGARLSNISIGDNTMIESGVKIVGTGKGKITIGKECYVGINNILDSSDHIIIGDFVHIAGPSTGLWCHSSAQMCINSIPLADPKRDVFRPTSPIFIENNVYIGCNCTIYPGVTIGHNVIIAPNSAVSKNVEPNSMIGGVPAKKIKDLYQF